MSDSSSNEVPLETSGAELEAQTEANRTEANPDGPPPATAAGLETGAETGSETESGSGVQPSSPPALPKEATEPSASEPEASSPAAANPEAASALLSENSRSDEVSAHEVVIGSGVEGIATTGQGSALGKVASRAKAPKREKPGSLADRAREFQSAASEANMKTLNKVLRWVTLLLAAFVLIPMFFGAIIKRHFYLLVARNVSADTEFFWATDELAALNAPEAVDLFISGLRTSDSTRRAIYSNHVHKFAGPEQRPLLETLLGKDRCEDRRAGLYACYFLAGEDWLIDEPFTKTLAAQLRDDPDPLCRIYAAMTLERSGRKLEEHRDVLVKGCGDADTSVRRICTGLLGKIDDPSLSPLFAGLLRDPEQEVRNQAVTALARLQDLDSMQSLVRHFEATGGTNRVHFVRSLRGVSGNESMDLLIRACDDEDGQVAIEAVRVLGERQSPRANPTLARLLESAHGGVRVEAARILGRRGVAEAIPELISALSKASERAELESIDEALQKLSAKVGIAQPSGVTNGSVKQAWLGWFEAHKAQLGS